MALLLLYLFAVTHMDSKPKVAVVGHLLINIDHKLHDSVVGSSSDSLATSVAVLAEILVRSPRKIFSFIMKKKCIYLWDQSIKKKNEKILHCWQHACISQ